MKPVADIAEALLNEPCPECAVAGEEATLKHQCEPCLADALQAYGDERAREEREACATLADDLADEEIEDGFGPVPRGATEKMAWHVAAAIRVRKP